MKQKFIIATDLLRDALQRHQIHLSVLVADTGLWVNPEFHRRLIRDTGSVALYPKCRRARRNQNERRGQTLDSGIRLDDNSYANLAIKRATGLGKQAKGFEACHIWPLTCYDERYHTAVANIVLLPRALAGLSDHDAEIQKALQYRAYELYAWWPGDLPMPIKPDFYPTTWREPLPDPQIPRRKKQSRKKQILEEVNQDLLEKIRNWSKKPGLNVHKIIALIAQSEASIPRDELVRRVAELTHSRSPSGAIASLLTDKGNAYGRVLEDVNGIIRIHPAVAETVHSLRWQEVLTIN